MLPNAQRNAVGGSECQPDRARQSIHNRGSDGECSVFSREGNPGYVLVDRDVQSIVISKEHRVIEDSRELKEICCHDLLWVQSRCP